MATRGYGLCFSWNLVYYNYEKSSVRLTRGMVFRGLRLEKLSILLKQHILEILEDVSVVSSRKHVFLEALAN